MLGFNVFDPDEVVLEFTADVGTKKSERVDYAIMANGSPIMLFECKHYGVELSKEPASQLYRYSSVTAARLGVLTDGVTYRFFSDIDEPNKMDQRPFLELNMLEAESIDADELKRFTKPAFDLDRILDTSKDLKYTRQILRLLAAEWANPSEALVRHFASQVLRRRDARRNGAVAIPRPARSSLATAPPDLEPGRRAAPRPLAFLA